MSSTTSTDIWKLKTKGDEARYVREKDQAQLEAIRNSMEMQGVEKPTNPAVQGVDIKRWLGQDDPKDHHGITREKYSRTTY
ncbi:hypothetical protein BDZ94DRAFT_81856 [Collybia nuda]|uniref:Uncharacterized protein n=1 Tax=Collybia nuda TaxID=64659 RepID=A0A9P6CF71_9AGAR|nr:hypothetical protein BDZ94DRAFT_81856 [Collybia nuda]